MVLFLIFWNLDSARKSLWGYLHPHLLNLSGGIVNLNDRKKSVLSKLFEFRQQFRHIGTHFLFIVAGKWSFTFNGWHFEVWTILYGQNRPQFLVPSRNFLLTRFNFGLMADRLDSSLLNRMVANIIVIWLLIPHGSACSLFWDQNIVWDFYLGCNGCSGPEQESGNDDGYYSGSLKIRTPILNLYYQY